MFHQLDSNNTLVIPHDPPPPKKKKKEEKKVPLALWKKDFLNVSRHSFGSREVSEKTFEKCFVLHLQLGIRKKCTDTSPGLPDIIV